MKHRMVVGEWWRAVESLGAAEALLRESYDTDAVSRAYYAIMHASKAALFIHDVETKSHAGTKRMFGLHLIRTGEIEPQWSDCLAEGMDERLVADYDVHIRFSAEEAEQQCERTRIFLGRIRKYLLENGLTDDDLGKEVRDG